MQLISSLESIAGINKNYFKALAYFYQTGCSFGKDLQKVLGFTLPTSHRILDTLVEADFIKPLSITNIPQKNGPKTTLYTIPGTTVEEVDQAVARELYYNVKNYSLVESLYQRTLPEICDESIQMSKIVSMARNTGSSRGGLHFIDIAEHVARKHIRSGVKVWR